jgi:hypothetical protein
MPNNTQIRGSIVLKYKHSDSNTEIRTFDIEELSNNLEMSIVLGNAACRLLMLSDELVIESKNRYLDIQIETDGKPFKSILIETFGDVSLKNVISKTTIVFANKLSIYSQVEADDMIVNLNKVYVGYGGVLRGINNLSITAVNYTFAMFGSQIRGDNVNISTGVYVNLLGLVRAYNFCVDSFVPLDIGVTVPSFPNTLNNITNKDKIIIAFRQMMAKIYQPVGAVLKVIHKMYSIALGGKRIYDNRNPKEDERGNEFKAYEHKLRILNTFLTVKSILFAMLAIYSERGLLLPADHPDAPKYAAPSLGLSALYETLPGILPAYVSDGVAGGFFGAIATGGFVPAELVTVKDFYNQTGPLVYTL